MNRVSALLLLSLPLCLEACASPGTYPSLSLRDAEREIASEALEPAVPEAPPPSSSLLGRVEQLLGQAKSGHMEFAARRDSAQRAVAAARGSSLASDSWVEAHVALGSLDAARNPAITALSEIDRLYADERITVFELVSPSAELLGSAREQVKAWVEEENGIIDQLTRQLES
jgi:hypothetical protein